MPKAAVIQMTSGTEVQGNLGTASVLLKQAAEAGAVLAVLPENFVLMGKHEHDKFSIAENFGDGVIQSWLGKISRELGLWIVAGTMPLKIANESRVAAASLVFDAQGHCVTRYDKMHLFDVEVNDAHGSYRESASIVHGRTPVCVDTPIGKVGLAICYDLRFPELFRILSAQGAQVFVIPAAFTVPTGRAHWEVLLRARAIENLCYVLAAAQVDKHENGRETYGHSIIIDPWGETLAYQPSGQNIAIAEIDLNHQAVIRQHFPALSQRRL